MSLHLLVIRTALKSIETREEQQDVDNVERTYDCGPLTAHQDRCCTRPDTDPAQHLAKVIGMTAAMHR